MFCFLQLPYHPKSTVHIACREAVCTRRRLYQYYSTEMTARVMENTRRHLGELEQKERRMLFRRSHSEPLNSTSESINMTSRTDPEWNMSVDSISLQSSFVDYQQRRKQRLRRKEEHKMEEISLSSEISASEPEMKEEQLSDIKMPSTLSLSDSENTHSSNDITSSQAKEISYEDEMRLFMEKNGHLVTNVFADPFDSDERKSRTELWVEASTENLVEEVEKEEKAEPRKIPDKPPITHQDTQESLVSSNITVSSIKNFKNTYKEHLKEATEAQSEIDVNDVDRFWDYLYKKDEQENDSGGQALLDAPSTSDSDRSLGMSLSPIKVEFAGIVTKKDEMGEKEQDREVEEVVLPTQFFQLKSTEITKEKPKPTAKKSESLRSVSQNSIEREHLIRAFSFKLSENLFKDLKVLLVERDRAKEAIRILPAKSSKELSDECNYFQTRYRVRIEQNKEKLDRRIDEIWRKLLKMPIDSQEILDFISVAHSEQLTVNARRSLPQMLRLSHD